MDPPDISGDPIENDEELDGSPEPPGGYLEDEEIEMQKDKVGVEKGKKASPTVQI